MNRSIEDFSKTHFDVLVVGGGINGAAIANLGAYNGLKVALLEKGEFGSGTSSRSSKLLHGGLRYLENFEFGLVRESLRERTIQLRSAPALTRSLGFLVPVYRDSSRPLWMVKLGVALYDWLSGAYLIERHQVLDVDAILRMAPHLKKEGLVGGVLYFDAQMDDQGLCVANVKSAEHQGAQVADYVKVEGFLRENGKTIGVKALDLRHPEHPFFKIRAKKVVVATGPWTNGLLRQDNRDAPLRVRTTKGVHFVYDDVFCEHAILLPIKTDGRVFFVIPWHGKTLVGTTDTDYSGDPDKVVVETEDLDYLIEELRRFFPDVSWDAAKITSSFAGLRPLVSEQGPASKISRKHRIETSFSGVVYVMGGKYTTYRKIAEDTLRTFVKDRLKDTRDQYPLFDDQGAHS